MSGEALKIELMQRWWDKLPNVTPARIAALLDVHSQVHGIADLNWPHHLTADLSNRLATLTWIQRKSR